MTAAAGAEPSRPDQPVPSTAAPAAVEGTADREVSVSEPDLLAARVLSCAHVAALSSGPFGQFLSYLPGRTVAGVRADTEHVEVRIVARYGPTTTEIGRQVRAALAPLLRGRPLSITIDDIDIDTDTDERARPERPVPTDPPR